MSLYLKYRPIDFDSLIGQNFIKTTLKKAIKDDKTIGAYLFCGVRGTGKTSTARIFAKSINCTNIKEDGNPCLECRICTDFLDGRLVDIIEIDAASNTGVDNIRDIIEKAQFSPSVTKYKVYIIDEVHMLTKGAFNALLKILEEPPKHVKFILATTEVHKIPDTILSRCQRYDFKKIDREGIIESISGIAKKENVKIDEKSLDFIVKNSGGGLRNAISLFEQYIVDFEIKYENIINNLGLVGDDIYSNFLQKILDKDRTLIDDLDNFLDAGKNLNLFFKYFLFFTKNILLDNFKKQKNTTEIIKIISTLDDAFIKSKTSFDSYITFLIALVKIIDGNFIDEKIEIKHKKQNNIIKKEKKVEPQKVEKIITNTGDLTEDANDIFGAEVEAKKINTENTGKIDLIILAKTVKKLGGKAFLGMGIKQAKYNIGKNIITMSVNTKFVADKMNSVESLAVIKKALEEMGFAQDIEIKS